MLNLLLSPFRKIYLYLGIALTAIATVFAYGKVKENAGREELLQKQAAEDELKRIKAREAAFKEKRNVDGLSDSDLLDRLRRRSDDWGSL